MKIYQYLDILKRLTKVRNSKSWVETYAAFTFGFATRVQGEFCPKWDQ